MTINTIASNTEATSFAYKGKIFNARQMNVIREGLELNLDVSTYADPKYSWQQMGAIRKGLKKDLDVEVYADPKFSWEQMNETKQGGVMQKILIYIAAIAILSVSSFSFAKSSDDETNALAFIAICASAYDNLGLETKRLEQVENFKIISGLMQQREQEEVKARAILMLSAYSESGAGIPEIKYLCDNALY